MIIRKAIIDDYSGLLELYAELDELHRVNHPELFRHPEGNSRSLEHIQDLISSDNKELFVAEEDSKIIGLAECFVLNSPDFPILQGRQWVQLDSIAVRQAYQHQNIGSLLLDEVIRWAKSRGIERIELKVYSFNEKAISFYSRNGFTEIAKNLFLNLEDD